MDTILLTLSIICGQLVKFSIGSHGGLTLLDVMVIILCARGLLRTKLNLLKPPLWIKASFVFIFIALISLILTPLSLTPLEYFTSISYTIRLSLYILLGWLIYSNTSPPLKKNTHFILIISGIILAIIGLLQFTFLPDLGFLTEFGWDPHFYRTTSTFFDPNFLGAYLVLTLLLISENILSLKGKLRSTLFTIVYLALMTTFSRSSYVMFLLSFLALSVFKKSAKLASISIILFVLLLISFQIYIKAVNQVTPLDRGQTASYRFTTWQQGFEIFLKNPVLGVGFNAYKFALRQYNLGDEQFLAGHGATTNDSSLVHVASTTGILGLLAYLYFLFHLCRSWKKNPVLSAAMFGLIGHSFFVNSLFYPVILIWLILSVSSSYESTS